MIRILRTVLSRPPRNSAFLVAVVSLLALSFGAAADWYAIAGADKWMPATRYLVFEKYEVWRLFTTLFVHGDLGHLAANSLLYFILAYFLYGHFGFILFPFTACVLAVPMTALALITYPANTNLIGASGLVHLMGGLWLSLYFFISRDLSMSQRILRAGGVMLGIFFPTSFEPTTSYRTHFIGLGLGLMYGAIYYHMNERQFLASEVAVDEPDELSLDENAESLIPPLADTPDPIELLDPEAAYADFDRDDKNPPPSSRDH